MNIPIVRVLKTFA